MGGARVRLLGHEPLSPRALSQFRRRGELEEKHRESGTGSSRGERIPDPLESRAMEALAEPGQPAGAGRKVGAASQLKAQTRSAFVATRGP